MAYKGQYTPYIARARALWLNDLAPLPPKPKRKPSPRKLEPHEVLERLKARQVSVCSSPTSCPKVAHTGEQNGRSPRK